MEEMGIEMTSGVIQLNLSWLLGLGKGMLPAEDHFLVMYFSQNLQYVSIPQQYSIALSVTQYFHSKTENNNVIPYRGSSPEV